MSDGDDCTFSDPMGNGDVDGTCTTVNDRDVVCQPTPGPDFTACDNKKEGSSCSFTDPNGGNSISGSCTAVGNGDSIVCQDPNAPDPPSDDGNGPPEKQDRRLSDPISACSGASSGDSCTYTGPDGSDTSGVCTDNPNGDFVCMHMPSAGEAGSTGGGAQPPSNECENAAADSACQFENAMSGEMMDGTCQTSPLGDMMCMPQMNPAPGGDEGGDQGPTNDPDDGDHGAPPQEAACSDKSADATCSYEDPRTGDTTGTCTLNPLGTMICMQTGDAPAGGNPPPTDVNDSNDSGLLMGRSLRGSH